MSKGICQRVAGFAALLLTGSTLLTLLSCNNTIDSNRAVEQYAQQVDTTSESIAEAVQRLESQSVGNLNASDANHGRSDTLERLISVNEYKLQRVTDTLTERDRETRNKGGPILLATASLRELLIEQDRLRQELILQSELLVELQTIRQPIQDIHTHLRLIDDILQQWTDNLNSLRKQQKLVQLAREEYEAAAEGNYSFGTECTLYLLGFKGLGGLFTGYAPTTTTGAQQERLSAEEARLAELVQNLDGVNEKLIASIRPHLSAIRTIGDTLTSIRTSYTLAYELHRSIDELITAIETLIRTRSQYTRAEENFNRLLASGALRVQEIYSLVNNFNWGTNFLNGVSGHYETRHPYDLNQIAFLAEKNESENIKQDTLVKENDATYSNTSSTKGDQQTKATYGKILQRRTDDFVPIEYSAALGPNATFASTSKFGHTIEGDVTAQELFALNLSAVQRAQSAAEELYSSIYKPYAKNRLILPNDILVSAHTIGTKRVADLQGRLDEVQQMIAHRLNIATPQAGQVIDYSREHLLQHAEALEKGQRLLSEWHDARKRNSVDLEHEQALTQLIDHARATHESYQQLLDWELLEEEAYTRVVMAHEALRIAGSTNGSRSTEFLLYLFGFKWFGGVFTGYAPTASTSEEQAALEQASRELTEVRESIQKSLPGILDAHRQHYKLTLATAGRLQFESGTINGAAVTAFIKAFTNIFQEYDRARLEHRNAYELYLDTINLRRQPYAPANQGGLEGYQVAYRGAKSPLISVKLGESEYVPELNKPATSWEEHDIALQREAYMRSRAQLESMRNRMYLFANVWQNTFEHLVSEIDQNRVDLARLELTIRETFANYPDLVDNLPLELEDVVGL